MYQYYIYKKQIFFNFLNTCYNLKKYGRGCINIRFIGCTSNKISFRLTRKCFKLVSYLA